MGETLSIAAVFAAAFALVAVRVFRVRLRIVGLVAIHGG